MNNAIGKCCAGIGGNLIYAIDFFRNGASYYKVTEKIDISPLPCEEIAKLPIEKILLIAKSAIHSIKILHGLKIVHGDLKPDNLLIKEASKGYVAKLIDFDDSYFEGNPPADRENLVGTPEYYSPEQAAYIMDEDEEIKGSTLTCKSDIFTLGIILCEYFTGEKPKLSGTFKSTWTCVDNDGSISFSKPLHSEVDALIRKMLSLNPNDRPNIGEVLNTLKNLKPEESSILKEPPATDVKKGGLRFGPGFKPVKADGIIDGTIKTASSPSAPKPKDPDIPKKSGGLRGSLLKIADK